MPSEIIDVAAVRVALAHAAAVCADTFGEEDEADARE